MVHFSNTSAWTRFGAQPQQYWELAGEGQVNVEQDRVVLRGRRPRPFWTAARAEIPISLTDIVNVIREGSVVQCHVRVSGATKVLRLWAANEQAAEQLEQVLPHERTVQFEQQLVEHSSFNTALAALGTRPVITAALLILNCLVFACTVYAGAGFFQANGPLLVHWGSNLGPRTLDGEWWRLFTSTFLHFGVLHLAFNMWALWSMGQLTEKLYGSAHFLVLYVFAGVSGSLASLYWHPGLNSAGASGAIFGVLGGLVAFMVNPKTRIPASVAALHGKSAAIFIIYNLLNGSTHAGIDNAAHIGGLAGGFVIGWVLARPVDVEARHDPLPRLATGILLGGFLLLGMSWPLLRPEPSVAAERDVRHEFQLFAEDEEKALIAQEALDKLEASNNITHREWGRRVAVDIIPLWQSADDRISATELSADSRLAPLRRVLLEYLEQKRFALDLLSDAARYDDPEKLEWGTQVSISNKAKAEQIKALIRQVF
ncbi:MAG: rhomboid family intramembrane serine protease [Steroidobacteraceae bacterium]